jgi:hypothetical protein
MKTVIRSHNEGLNFLTLACRDLGEHFDKPQLIEIKRYKPPRSLPQNARCHAMIGELANEIGFSAAELKSWLKIEFGPHEPFTFGNYESYIPKSTAKYNRQEMSDFMMHIERIGAEMGFQFSEGET